MLYHTNNPTMAGISALHAGMAGFSALPPGTESFQCEQSPSGHLILPCTDYESAVKDEDLTLLSKKAEPEQEAPSEKPADPSPE